eukprot:403374678
MKKRLPALQLYPLQHQQVNVPNTHDIGNDFQAQKIQYLEKENQRLQEELRASNQELNYLRDQILQMRGSGANRGANSAEGHSHVQRVLRQSNSVKENINITNQLPQNLNIQKSPQLKQQHSVVNVAASDIDMINCQNCEQAVSKGSYGLHQIYCQKNFQKCYACQKVCALKDIERHIAQSRGTLLELIQAVQQGDKDRILIMEKHGLDNLSCINEDDNCNTLLHYAVKAGMKEMTEHLLMRGIQVNIPNAFGETALHYCSGQVKNVELAKLLFFKGANPYIKNSLGDSPLDLAKRYGNYDLVSLYTVSESTSTIIASSRISNVRELPKQDDIYKLMTPQYKLVMKKL